MFVTLREPFSCFLQQCEDKWGHLCALADFSLALTESIQEINKHSFNNFELRIGELQLEVENSLSQVSLFHQPLPCPGHQARKAFSCKMHEVLYDPDKDKHRVNSGLSGLPHPRCWQQGRILTQAEVQSRH